MKIVITGAGYVGLVTGACFAEKGIQVIFLDTNISKIEKLKKGIVPIYERGLEELLKKNEKKGRIEYTTDYTYAYEQADTIFITVETPKRLDGTVNVDSVYKAAKQIAESIRKECSIIIKSTVPVGTNEKIETYIQQHLVHPVKIEVISNPEFLSQGTAIQDTLQASRIIIGAESKSAQENMQKIYENFEIPIVYMSRRSSEMTKYAANNFLAMKISYMNELANLCEKVGANIDEIANGMSYDKRIGADFLRAGCGYGGSCFPKDTQALQCIGKQVGVDLPLIEATIQINKKQKLILIEKARKKIQTFKGVHVAILGLAFKPCTDDIREAPALDNIQVLLEEGAYIKAYDAKAIENTKRIYPSEIEYTTTPQEALQNADICFIFTESQEIKDIQPKEYVKWMKHAVVYDGRNLYDVEKMQENGIQYKSVGRI